MALVITLVMLVLITLLVVIFLSVVSLDRQATSSYAKTIQADSIALGGLDQVISQLQAEIADPANSTTNGTLYVPITNSNAVPQRMCSLLPVVTYSGTNVYSNAANVAALESFTTNASLNGRVVSMNRWYQPQLTLTTNGFPTPQWILVTRNGTFPTTWSSSLADHSVGNGTCVIGRYAYVVYDTSGLVDVNVAGYPVSAATNAANKGIMPWVDLTQLTNALTQSDVDNLINWRNAANSPAYAAYATNWATSGFMQVAPGDTTFLSRQELIKYAQTQNPDLTNALPYLTTFSRELNGPTWGPETNLGVVDGTNFNYQTLATSVGSYNPLIYNPLVQTSFTRDNGVTAIVGEPLVKYRFPLNKLALLEKMQGVGTLTATDLQQIQQYFGLDLASDVTATSGYYRHWNYPTTNPAYPHGLGSGATGIMSLSDVATYGHREPDFFELLQAGILQGSLGVYSMYQRAGSLQAHARSDILGGNGSATYLNGLSISDVDPSKTYQILRIGANIIDQWHADNYPTTITYVPSGLSVYGICDLPYITALFENVYSTPANMVGGTTVPACIYICPQIWNPHQPSGATNTPNQFRITPDSGDEWFIEYNAPGINGSTNGGIFKYDANNGTFPGSASQNTAAESTPFGTTNSIVFTAGASAYRDPSMITNASAGNAAGQWSPSNPTIGAIQIDNLPFPPSNLMDTADPIGAGCFSAASVSAAQPTNSASHGSTQITWAQATNNANYAGFNISTGTPIYNFDWAMNGVFLLEYYNPANGIYYPYSTFEGFANSTNLATGFNFGSSFETVQTNAAALPHVDVWVKSDPRTFRFGPGRRSPGALGSAPQSAPYLSIFPTNTLATNLVNQAEPFASGTNSISGSTPYRFDMWAINDPHVALSQGQAASIPTTNVAYYTDPDGAYRYGDSHYSYVSSTGYATPFLTGQTTYRPVVLHRPFRSVGELGYVFRDDPWRTLDFFSPGSADAGLLDLFTLSGGQTVIEHNGQQTVVTAGRVNPNTPYPQVLAAMMAGATQNIAGGTSLSTNNAFNLATNLVMLSSNAPIMNRADLATRFMTNATFASAGLYLKGDREAVIRSLAESSNTRTWNFLIDIDAQSGIYPSTATSLNNFAVGGERHYWLHIAIDRYTGQVVDRQLEMVDQ